MRELDEMGLAEADLGALMRDAPERPLRERHGVLDDLGLREADLAALVHDLPERSLYEQCLDEELAEEERERQRSARAHRPRSFRWTGPRTDDEMFEAMGGDDDLTRRFRELSPEKRRALERVVEGADAGHRPSPPAGGEATGDLARALTLAAQRHGGTLSADQITAVVEGGGFHDGDVPEALRLAEADVDWPRQEGRLVESLGLSGEEEAEALLEELRG